MQETVPATATKERMDKFMELLEKAFQEMSPKGDAAAFILKFDNAFDNKRREDNIEFLNISFEPIDQDFTHGTGKKMFKPQYANEPNINLGSNHFQALIDPENNDYPNYSDDEGEDAKKPEPGQESDPLQADLFEEQ